MGVKKKENIREGGGWVVEEFDYRKGRDYNLSGGRLLEMVSS